ncbi:hypothetical protein LXL04_036632 [Taraxacum kok-saghyz]
MEPQKEDFENDPGNDDEGLKRSRKGFTMLPGVSLVTPNFKKSSKKNFLDPPLSRHLISQILRSRHLSDPPPLLSLSPPQLMSLSVVLYKLGPQIHLMLLQARTEKSLPTKMFIDIVGRQTYMAPICLDKNASKSLTPTGLTSWGEQLALPLAKHLADLAKHLAKLLQLASPSPSLAVAEDSLLKSQRARRSWMCVKVLKPSSEVNCHSASVQLTIFLLDESGYIKSISLYPRGTT